MAITKIYLIFLIAGSSLLLLPFFFIQLPPLQDYPNHLARIHILTQIKENPALQEYYKVQWAPLPNLAMDLVIPVLTLFVPLETAGRWFCMAVLLTTAPAATALSYALHKKLSLWPLFSMLFAYNFVFTLGILNYLLGLNLALAGSALWIFLRQKPVRHTAPLFVLVSLVIYFVHLSALGIYAMVVFGYELSTYLARRRDGLPADKTVWVVGLSQFLLPAGMFLAFSPTFRLNLGAAGVYDPWSKVQGVYGVLNSGHPGLDMLSFVIVGMLLLAGAVLGKLTVHKRAATAFWVLMICFAAAPEVLFGSGFASYRLPVAIVLLLVAASDWRPMPKPVSGLLFTALAALFVVRIGTAAQDWRAFGHDHRQVIEAFDSVPEKSRILPYVVNEGSGHFLAKPPLQHLATLAVIQRSAFVPTLFSDPARQPVGIRERYQDLGRDVPRDIAPKEPFLKPLDDPGNPFHESRLAGFDYVLLFAMKPLSFAIPDAFRRVAGGDKFTLYRVDP